MFSWPMRQITYKKSTTVLCQPLFRGNCRWAHSNCWLCLCLQVSLINVRSIYPTVYLRIKYILPPSHFLCRLGNELGTMQILWIRIKCCLDALIDLWTWTLEWGARTTLNSGQREYMVSSTIGRMLLSLPS
jgi:hypothetical protein